MDNVLRKMGFTPSKSEPYVWMQRKDDVYEYVAVYDPLAIIDPLGTTYSFKLKGTGPLSFHLGMNFFRDDSGVLSYSP